MKLTEEKLETIESEIRNNKFWGDQILTKSELVELARGYRAMLKEVERLEAEIQSKRNHIAYLKREGLKSVGPEITLKELESRLAALQKEGV